MTQYTRGIRDALCGAVAIALIVVSIFMTSGCHPQIYPDGNLAFIGKAIPILRPTFYAPGGPAARAFESEVAWCGRATKLGEIDPNVAPPFAWTSFAQLDGAVEPHLAPLPRADLGTLVAEFLHISDAQIRDEALYEEYDVQRKLGMLDGLIPVTVRNGLIERNDCLTFAAFLSSYSKGTNWVEWKPHRFIVHTGDLLDISVRTELIPALQAMRDAKTTYGAKIYSVAGNHDGSTFGNIPDSASDTRALGINRSEFVLAHL
ncbi:MAG: hypothetical protein ACRDHN_00695, partial [Thermomicrobiales bacterium]